VFCALDTFSKVGGIQSFNQRVIRSLGSMNRSFRVHLMRDKLIDLPDDISRNISAHGACRLCFIVGVLRSILSADTLLIGHINLLPIGALAKILNPNLKTILFVHGDEVWNNPMFRKRRWYEPLLVKVLDRVASVSQYTANVMAQEFGVDTGLFVIFPNAVDPPTYDIARSPSNQNVLVVSRLAEHDAQKHVDAVIKAFGMIASQAPLSKLEIVGDGVLRPQLEELVLSLGLSDRVIFHGRVSDTDLAHAYARARLFAMPSNKEGFGIVFLEAWLRGLPVICGSEGASREIISHGLDGFVVDPRKLEELADRIVGLLADYAQAERMGQQGFEKVHSRYLGSHFRENLLVLLSSPSV
jgi:phosphatidylinositol alpha-1,6-mannosyltransferase